MTTPFKALQKKDIAEALGCSIRQVEIMVRDGTLLKPTLIGGMVRWHPDMFRTWFDNLFRNVSVDEAEEESESKIQTPLVATKSSRGKAPQSSAAKRMFARQASQLNFA